MAVFWWFWRNQWVWGKNRSFIGRYHLEEPPVQVSRKSIKIWWWEEQISVKNAKMENTLKNTWMQRKSQWRYGEVGLEVWNRAKGDPNPKEMTRIDAVVVEKFTKECAFCQDPTVNHRSLRHHRSLRCSREIHSNLRQCSSNFARELY